ncbi:MAG: redox-sensing transcriptional repressor Rex [bacterium]|nr:redox-sensing transcriptional repressor Rex [bacterium]
MEKKIPKNTVKRLSVYLRCLNKLQEDGIENVSSSEFGELIGINPAQIRKDLSYFGEFVRQGLGDNIEKLKNGIKKIIGLNETQNIILIGVGNLGKAILNYNVITKRGFSIIAAFDKDPEMIGKIINNVGVFDIKKIDQFIAGKNIKCAILTLPPDQIRKTIEKLYQLGIKGFLNFAPISLNLSKDIQIVNVDLSSSLEVLMFYLRNNSE